jgi:hypothetical protein
MKGETQQVRVEKETLKKVKKIIIKTGQSVCGFFTVAAEEKLKKQKQ